MNGEDFPLLHILFYIYIYLIVLVFENHRLPEKYGRNRIIYIFVCLFVFFFFFALDFWEGRKEGRKEEECRVGRLVLSVLVRWCSHQRDEVDIKYWKIDAFVFFVSLLLPYFLSVGNEISSEAIWQSNGRSKLPKPKSYIKLIDHCSFSIFTYKRNPNPFGFFCTLVFEIHLEARPLRFFFLESLCVVNTRLLRRAVQIVASIATP